MDNNTKIVHNLFPTAVAIYNIKRELSNDEIQFILEQEKKPNMGNSNSADHKILRTRELSGICGFIEDSLEDYLCSVYDPQLEVSLKITDSWCNYTEQGQYHHRHNHPNSLISGVFYPQADANSDKIYFYKSLTSMIRIPPREWNIWNSDSWWLSVGTGDLVIFPSALEHMVEPVERLGMRISLSFNTFPVGVIEDSKLMGLKIVDVDS